MNWEVYEKLLTARGDSAKDRIVNTSIEHFRSVAPRSAGYEPDCKRNGTAQRFLVDRTQTAYKYDFIAFPGESIETGDLIECDGHVFIICEPPRVLNEVILVAKGWLCNLHLRWQNGTKDIFERWCVLDSGVYSTTKTNDDQYSVPDKQFRLYIPYDSDTKKLFVDKRIATDVRYNALGKEILECYAITGYNHIARSYGGHLMICELRSSLYNEEKDSLTEMICDYIGTADGSESGDGSISISGRKTIRIGTSRSYSAVGVDSNEISWRVSDFTGVSHTPSNDKITVKVNDDRSLVGKTIRISVLYKSGEKQLACIDVGVTA